MGAKFGLPNAMDMLLLIRTYKLNDTLIFEHNSILVL